MNHVALQRALTDPGPRLLPDVVSDLLGKLDAPARLAAHLRAVHDVAWQLADWMESRYPAVSFDRTLVLFGAATHDIGKIIHPHELSKPGSAHECAGYELLMAQGFDESAARFARTHACWTEPGIEVNDLIVSLADKIWKGKRVPDLEQLLVERLAAGGQQQCWEIFSVLDDELDRIAAAADERLAFQASNGVSA
ncbi:HD domain-containing protein [Nocardia sp. NPDC058705]|uniref:HD domain-containing protein n=1 Tax=Nocardia sp. NPDC058705 TaxID=3346609 RepID=UPI0036A5ACEC